VVKDQGEGTRRRGSGQIQETTRIADKVRGEMTWGKPKSLMSEKTIVSQMENREKIYESPGPKEGVVVRKASRQIHGKRHTVLVPRRLKSSDKEHFDFTISAQPDRRSGEKYRRKEGRSVFTIQKKRRSKSEILDLCTKRLYCRGTIARETRKGSLSGR